MTALLKQGAEASFAVLLANLHKSQQDLTLEASQARVAAAQADLALANAQLANLNAEMQILRAGAMNLIRTARANLDALLGMLFRAQRSVDIYCSTPPGYVPLAAGFVHLDVEADYLQGYDPTGARFMTHLTESWGSLVSVATAENTYQNYFASADLGVTTLRLSFTDAALLNGFRESNLLTFSVSLGDLPATMSDAKVVGVRVGLAGAQGLPVCEVTHNGIYDVKTRDGSIVSMHLHAHSTLVDAFTTQLSPLPSDLIAGNPLSAPKSLGFWGRGVAAGWALSLHESSDSATDLTSMTQIQVWILYQGFLR